MKPFRGRSSPLEAPLPWLVEWRGENNSLSLCIPFRVVREINEGCNGPEPWQMGALLGYRESDSSGSPMLQVLYAVQLAINAEGNLTASAIEQLAGSSPSPDRRIGILGLFVPGNTAQPQSTCSRLAPHKSFLPQTLPILVMRGYGVGSVFLWDTRSDQTTLLPPELRLESPQTRNSGQASRAQQAVAPSAAPAANPLPARGLPVHGGTSITRGLPAGATPESQVPSTVRRMADIAAPAPAGTTVRFELPRWVWATMLSLVAVAVAASLWYLHGLRKREPAAAPQPTAEAIPSNTQQLGMQVTRRGNDLLISWDRNTAFILEARGGMLLINDGNQITELPLSMKDVTSGQVLYIPRSRDIQVELTIFTASKVLGETLRVVQAAGPSAANKLDAGSNFLTLRSHQSPASAGTRSSGIQQGDRNAEQTGETSDESIRKVFLPPPAGPVNTKEPPGTIRTEPAQPAEVSSLSAPPNIDLSSRRPVASPPISLPMPTAAPPAPPKPAAAETANAKPSPRQSVLEPPVAIRQVTPVLPPTIKRLLVRDTTVEVKLQIDEEGRVMSAQASDTSTFQGLLGRVAEDAVRRWRFRPAQLNGKPVPADHTIVFRFPASLR